MRISTPIISNKEDNVQNMTFTLSNTNYSIANSIRRTLLSDIPVVAFRTLPYTENMCNIIENTTRFNNEMTKQRLSCVPIHMKVSELPDNFDNLIVEINEKNDTFDLMHITTENFRIKDEESGQYMQQSKVSEIFPPSQLTGDYILFSRLRPKISEETSGEKLNLQAKMVVTTPKENGSFNVVSTCSYAFSPDTSLQQKAWSQKKKELEDNGLTQERIEFEKMNWYNHDAKRHSKKDSFDFIIESVGTYTNEELIRIACDVLIKKYVNLQSVINNGKLEIRNVSDENTMKGCFDITLENEDYTIGKCIEYILHEAFYQNGDLSYVGFLKPHPHESDSIIRIAFKKHEDKNESHVNAMFKQTVDTLIDLYETIQKEF